MSSGFKKANLVSMSKATTVNDKNVNTKITAATFENEIGSEEVSGERVWRNCGYFDTFILRLRYQYLSTSHLTD